jgi:hypothetical protein
MTEEDAKKRWCPFARVYSARTDKNDETTAMASVNRMVNGRAHPKCPCLASRCMAWIWQDAKQGECGLARSRLL